MLIIWKKGIHEFLLTALPWSLFNALIDLSNIAFVSKFFISKDFLILFLFMLGNFGCSQLNQLSQSLECLVAPEASHFPVMLSSWCAIDQVSTRFSFSPMYFPHNQKRRGNCLVIVYFCFCITFFSYKADFKMTLHTVFPSSFLILGPIIGIYSSLRRCCCLCFQFLVLDVYFLWL